MPNGKLGNGNRISNESYLVGRHNDFLREQLIDAQQSLFFARSVKEAKFLQSRIDFLKKQLKFNGTKMTANGRKK